MKILVVNCGSSSLKYQLIDMDNEQCIAKGNCQKIGADDSFITINVKDEKVNKKVSLPDHVAAFNSVIDILVNSEYKVIDSLEEIDAIGHRVVQGGDIYTKSVIVDSEVTENIKKLSALAPLHNPAHVQGINACIDVLGEKIPQVTVFDNAFHSTMPEEAYTFAIPKKYVDQFGVKIRRYGAHGTSHKFVAHECAKIMGKDIKDLKIITCHIGNGASITAVKNGKVIDTSMGITPLGGVPMGTRCGDIDPSVITFLQSKLGWTPEETEKELNNSCGLLGMSDGFESDDRALRNEISENAHGHAEDCRIARKVQHYQIKKYIGAYAAAMNGVDAIVITAGLGENDDSIRKDICGELDYLGVKFDDEANEKLPHGEFGEISKADSKVKVYVIPTNEELMIARETKALVE